MLRVLGATLVPLTSAIARHYECEREKAKRRIVHRGCNQAASDPLRLSSCEPNLIRLCNLSYAQLVLDLRHCLRHRSAV